jgi:high-affinity Fe2+/Pb2+ permease
MTRRVTVGAFVALGLLVAVLLAVVVAPHASREPDGLNRVAIDQGFADDAQPHALEDTPTADGGLPTGVAAVLGVGVTFALGFGLFALVRRNNTRDDVAERA